MKRLLTFLLTATLLLSSFALAAAEPAPITVVIDGKVQTYEQPPVVVDGSTFVPLRAIFEALGAKIDWDAQTRTVTAVKGSKTISLTVGSDLAYINGASHKLAQPARIISDRTMVPLRFVGEALGAEVRWYGETRTVEITSNVGGVISFGVATEPDSLVPILSTNTNASLALGLIYDSLLTLNEKYETGPGLATSFTVENDRVYTFQLREDVKWHDGQRFTAHDVAFTFQAIAHPGYTGVRQSKMDYVKGAAALFKEYESIDAARTSGKLTSSEAQAAKLAAWEAWNKTGGIRVQGDYTFVIELDQPFAPTLIDFGAQYIIPAHIWTKYLGEGMKSAPAASKPIGTGGYRLMSWEKGKQIVLERNPDWKWGPMGTHNRIEQIVLKVIPLAQGLAEGVMLGQVDVVTVNTDYGDYIKQNVQSVKVYEYASLQYTFIGYNFKDPLVSDQNIRKAIAHAVNRDAMLSSVVGGHGTKVNSHGHPARWDFNPAVPAMEYDLSKAEALLDQAGWKLDNDGWRRKNGQLLQIELAVNNAKVRTDAAAFLQSALKAVGIKVNVRVMEWNAFLDYIDSDREQAFVLGWSMGFDPDSHDIFHSQGAFNRTMQAYSNPRVDELLERGRTVTDRAERIKIYHELQQTLAEEQVYTWLYAANTMRAISNRVKGVMADRLGSVGPEWHIENWYVSDDE